MNMRLSMIISFCVNDRLADAFLVVGAPTLNDLSPNMVDVSQATQRGTHAPADSLFAHNYEPLPALVTGGGLAAKQRNPGAKL